MASQPLILNRNQAKQPKQNTLAGLGSLMDGGNQISPQEHPILYSLQNLANIATNNANPRTELGKALIYASRQQSMMQQQRRMADFMGQAKEIMSTNISNEDFQGENEQQVTPGKISRMYKLVMTNPDIAEQLGIKEPIERQYEKLIGKQSAITVFQKSKIGEYIAPEGMEITGYDQKGMPMFRKKQPTPQEKEIAKAEGQVQAQTLKQKKQSETDFLVAKNKLRTTMSAFKAMTEAGGTGRIGGMLNVIGGKTGLNPYTEAYKGQLVEAAAALAKLAAPSARVGEEIINQFKQTLPSVVSTTPEAINQIRFSLQNAFATVLGKSNQEYTKELDDMITQMVSDIVDVKPMKIEDLKKFKPSIQNKIGKYTLIQ